MRHNRVAATLWPDSAPIFTLLSSLHFTARISRSLPKQPSARVRFGRRPSEMICIARRSANALTLLLAALLGVHSPLAACIESARGAMAAGCCCERWPAGNSAASHCTHYRNGNEADTCCADWGAVEATVWETPADAPCPSVRPRVPAPADARATAGQAARAQAATSPARTASARQICVALCRYRL